jgi:FixJ family two-component response regulator
VIVLDIAAFGATGTQLHAELLRDDPDVRVVLTTALPPTSLICAALSPAVPLLYQPVRGKALIDAVDGALATGPTAGLAEVLETYVASLRNLTSSPDLNDLNRRLEDCVQAREELLPKLRPAGRSRRKR